MAGHLDVPLNVVALHEFDTCHVVGPRRRFDGLPHDVLITTASQARVALGPFMRDSGTMTRLRILLANDASCGIACNRLKNPAVIERLANLVERGVFGLAQIKPIRTAAIRGLHQQFVQTHPASAEAQRACASVMPIANRPAHPPATLASLHRSGAHASSNSSQQVATPASPAPVKKAFSEWSLEDRFAEALKRPPPKLPSQFRNAFAEILTPEVAATVVGTLVLIAGAHAIGGLAAAAFDALLIGVAFVFLGWTAFEAGQQLGKFFYLTVTATDAAALDYAAEALAKVVVLIGVEALLVLLTKATVKATRRPEKRLGPQSDPSSSRSNKEASIAKKSAQSTVPVALGAHGSSRRIVVPSTGKILDTTKGQTTTILGSFSRDMENIIQNQLKLPKSTDFDAKPDTFNILNTPDILYKTPDQFWTEYNKPFLDAAILRQDIMRIATEPTLDVLYRADGSMTGFGRELQYLASKGYRYDVATGTMTLSP